MEDLQKLSAAKTYLRRGNTQAQIEALATEAFASVTDEVTITSHSVTDGGSSGEITFPKWLLLQACEEILAEIETGTTGRSLCAVARWDSYQSAN
jgi:hypothetical protein